MKREEKRKKNCIYIINNLETFGTKKNLPESNSMTFRIGILFFFENFLPLSYIR